MTATLVAKGLSGGYAARTLFDSLDLTVAPGDVIGVVGVNGAGKSTLLRLLAGVDEPLAGTVSLAPTDAFVGWLPQEHERIAGETVAAYLGRRTGCTEATVTMDAAAAALGDPDAGDAAADRYSTALDRWLAAGAADLEDRIPAVLADLGLEPGTGDSGADGVGPDSLMTALSGGQVARVGARCAAALAVRHRPARRADQRPRPGRPRPARGVRARAARRGGARQPRP